MGNKGLLLFILGIGCIPYVTLKSELLFPLISVFYLFVYLDNEFEGNLIGDSRGNLNNWIGCCGWDTCCGWEFDNGNMDTAWDALF